jgi:hypothetical protein
MSGELWEGEAEIGVEAGYGTAVASTRQMYFRPGSNLSTEREPRIHKFQTGTRDNVRNLTLGPEKAAGQVVLPISAEILELLEIGILGSVTAVGAGANKTWTFAPGTALNSATMRWHDGARPWRAAGVYAGKLNFKGSVDGENLVTADLFAKSLTQEALTGGLAHATPAVFEGWESKIYIDAFEGVAGTTVKTGLMLDWDVTIDNDPQRHYTADNTQTLSSITLNEIGVEATLTVLASAAQAMTEFTAWTAGTKRLIRLEFGNNTAIGATGVNEKIWIDLPGAWTAVDLNQESNGARAYQLKMNYVFDTVNAYGVQITVTTARADVFDDR